MSARAIWKGAITFGLVSIPVKLYATTEEHDIAFHQVHVHDEGEPGRIKYKRVCSGCGDEVAYGDIAKGYDAEQGTVILTKEDMDALPLNTTKTIEVEQFVPDMVPHHLREKQYVLVPENHGAAAYGVLVGTLRHRRDHGINQVGIAKVTLRQREQVCMLHIRNGRLVLTTLRWADEVRELPVVDCPEPTAEQIEMAGMLIDSMRVSEFDPTAFEDGYKAALQTVIDTKLAGEKPAPATVPEKSNVVDLMAALKASIEMHQKNRRAA